MLKQQRSRMSETVLNKSLKLRPRKDWACRMTFLVTSHCRTVERPPCLQWFLATNLWILSRFVSFAWNFLFVLITSDQIYGSCRCYLKHTTSVYRPNLIKCQGRDERKMTCLCSVTRANCLRTVKRLWPLIQKRAWSHGWAMKPFVSTGLFDI